MKKLLAVALSLSLLGACAPGSSANILAVATGHSVASVAPKVSLTAEKSLTLAHLAYNEVGELLIDAAEHGYLHGDNARIAKNWYDRAGDALRVADAADKAANEPGIFAAVADATDAIYAVKVLLNGKGK